MKFEQKLNKMHSEFRDLNSKYVRVDRFERPLSCQVGVRDFVQWKGQRKHCGLKTNCRFISRYSCHRRENKQHDTRTWNQSCISVWLWKQIEQTLRFPRFSSLPASRLAKGYDRDEIDQRRFDRCKRRPNARKEAPDHGAERNSCSVPYLRDQMYINHEWAERYQLRVSRVKKEHD